MFGWVVLSGEWPRAHVGAIAHVELFATGESINEFYTRVTHVLTDISSFQLAQYCLALKR